MRIYFCLFLVCSFFVAHSQDIVYEDHFDTDIFSVGNNPTGYTLQNVNNTFQINGNGAAGPWTAMSYILHDGAGNQTLIDASESPKLYIKVKGEGQPSLRIDFQDETGYVTNQNPAEFNITNAYKIYEYDYTDRLLDGAYGGPCTVAPCIVDASKLQSLIFFVNAPTGGYNGTIEIDWISIGAPLEQGTPSYDIRYNQVGYSTGRSKYINIVSSASFENVEYSVFKKGNSDPVLSAMTSGLSKWSPSNEYVSTIDVTELNDEGDYIFEIGDQSIEFSIANDGYDALATASLKYYYYNRASQELTTEFAAEWARPLGHPDDEVLIHSSAASTDRPTGTKIESPKGWYDAGDYNKYIVNSGISTYTLLAAYEHYPEYYKNLMLDIPEQGGILPDILDEVIWNLEWMLTMQDPNDGGVYHKLTGLNFSGIIMPHQYNATRYVVQKTTSAALNFAAVMAIAARVFADYEDVKPGFNIQLIEAAEYAYQWALDNPNVYYNQPSDVSTGQYGDNNVNDEFDWAIAELFLATEKTIYSDEISENTIGNGVPAWPYTAPLALMSLSHHAELINGIVDIETIENRLLETANQLKSTVENGTMKVAMGTGSGDFVWGSNGHAGNQIMILIRAYEISDDEQFLDAAYTAMDYLLGRNGTGYCYVSGFGDVSPQHPHHRPSEADAVTAPIPGMVAGGPNPGKQDGCPGYIGNYPASSYVDSWCSYASNEVTINWNAPFAYAVNALRFYQIGIPSSTTKWNMNEMKELKVSPNPGSDFIQLNHISIQNNNRFQIFNSKGEAIFTINNLKTNTVDLSVLAPGVYILHFENGQDLFSTKWIKVE